MADVDGCADVGTGMRIVVLEGGSWVVLMVMLFVMSLFLVDRVLLEMVEESLSLSLIDVVVEVEISLVVEINSS